MPINVLTMNHARARQALIKDLTEDLVYCLLQDANEGGNRLSELLKSGHEGFESYSDAALIAAVQGADLAEMRQDLDVHIDLLRQNQSVDINYCFLRYERAEVVNAASLKLRVLQGEDVEADYERFKKAISLWIATSVAGRNAWEHSSEDLNIGDLLMSNHQDADLQHCLAAFGLEIVEIDSIDTDEVKAYDEVLVDHGLLQRWSEEGQGQIEAQLALKGLRMEHSLDGLDGVGHPVCDLITGEMLDDPLDPEVIAMAEAWSIAEGVQS